MGTVFSWIHLADLADLGGRLDIGRTGRAAAKVVAMDGILQDVARLAQTSEKPQAILVTGDLVDKGRDYDRVRSFLEQLAASCALSSKDIFIVPGNHDVDLDNSQGSVRRLLHSIQNGEDSLDDVLRKPEERALLEQRFKQYVAFAGAWGAGSELCWSRRIAAQPVSIRLVGINTELLFTGTEDGRLRIGHTQLSLLEGATGEIVIALSHHPFEEAYVEDAKGARAIMAAHGHIHLASASYEGSNSSLIGENATTIRIMAGGRPRGGASRAYGYNMASIVEDEDGRLNVHVLPRRWSSTKSAFVPDVDVLPVDSHVAVIPIPVKKGWVPGVSGTGGGLAFDDRGSPVSPRKDLADEDAEYISRLRIEGIRALHQIDWAVSPRPGWNVLIGDNGSGKTTFLRALAYALVTSRPRPKNDQPYDDEADKLPCNIYSWVHGEGRIELWRQFEKSGIGVDRAALEMTISQSPQKTHLSFSEEYEQKGTFTASFGPFRRFTGGNQSEEQELLAFPRVIRHLSLFKESISFQETVQWLKDLRADALENANKGFFLEAVKGFINSEGFLPNGVRLDQITAGTSGAITFIDGNECRVGLDDLSDGFRSILSLALELLRQLALHHGMNWIFEDGTGRVMAPGIVLIDEVDAHLHPTWQREIGVCLRKLFPRIQFIVATHSPLVCQGAADEFGSIFRLPKPGTDEDGRMLEGVELARILYGNVLDAYGTGAFGVVERSNEGAAKRKRLVELNLKELSSGLSPDEENEQDALRAFFPTGK